MKNVPELRFKGLESNYEIKKISSLLERVSNSVDVNPIEFYRQIGIRSHGKGIFYKDAVSGESLGNKRVFWVEPNVFILNIVFAWERAVAKTTDAEIGMIASHRFPMYKPKSGVLDLDYITLFFKTTRGKYLLELASPGGAGRNKTLGQKEFENLELAIPTIFEQKKIAAFFSLIDKKIELQTEKVEELKNYKKGLMQKIFSQELRFKDENGKKYPEWEEKKLENIVEFFKGNGLSKSDLSDNEDIPCVLYGELFTQYDEVINVVKSRCLKDQGFKSEKYDVLMPTSDVTPEGLATASCILVDDVCLGGDINVLRPKKYINGIFLSYQINHFKSLIIRKVSGTTIKHIYVKDIKDIKYNIPCEKEQIKITDLLIQIDNKIKFESLKVESYNKLKKGLLQQMFI